MAKRPYARRRHIDGYFCASSLLREGFSCRHFSYVLTAADAHQSGMFLPRRSSHVISTHHYFARLYKPPISPVIFFFQMPAIWITDTFTIIIYITSSLASLFRRYATAARLSLPISLQISLCFDFKMTRFPFPRIYGATTSAAFKQIFFARHNSIGGSHFHFLSPGHFSRSRASGFHFTRCRLYSVFDSSSYWRFFLREYRSARCLRQPFSIFTSSSEHNFNSHAR